MKYTSIKNNPLKENDLFPENRTRGNYNLNRSKSRGSRIEDPKELFKQLKIDLSPRKKLENGSFKEVKGYNRKKHIEKFPLSIPPLPNKQYRDLLTPVIRNRNNTVQNDLFFNYEEKKGNNTSLKVKEKASSVKKRKSINYPLDQNQYKLSAKEIHTHGIGRNRGEILIPKFGQSSENDGFAKSFIKNKISYRTYETIDQFEKEKRISGKRISYTASKSQIVATRSFDYKITKESDYRVATDNPENSIKTPSRLEQLGLEIVKESFEDKRVSTVKTRAIIRPNLAEKNQSKGFEPGLNSSTLKLQNKLSICKRNPINTTTVEIRAAIRKIQNKIDSKVSLPMIDMDKSKSYFLMDVRENFYKEGFEEDEFSKIVKKSLFSMFKDFRDATGYSLAQNEDLKGKKVALRHLFSPGKPTLVLDIDETLIHSKTAQGYFKGCDIQIEIKPGQVFFVVVVSYRQKFNTDHF